MELQLKKSKAITRNLDEDYTFYTGETSLIKVEEGMFTIFFLMIYTCLVCRQDKALRLRKWL
jgi:beta-galactosidase beta subunit